ncbi:S1C family serine protease [Schinkia azotoformans]|uniref:Trypsin-like protein serine protease n=1 Tax=Schinkia azotoformans LMG 9581 TaxID=1131731 RepID=K6DK45_SCHAZ|nr:S1C family serine protease [Schinkia azotoformans]EKN68689.1 trypsin-like protein serine protease [Schinkia azotoformans LMG 9581]MEC1639014.1 S1C family serine protease [Schinkia azotoformans]MEC1945228.1 S1C family serine protease [Schinkia azotoformans]MED4353973.1 S1C family serine protease [Schinkia azotoformans]
MGYINEDYDNRRKNGSRGGYFIASLVGAILGALIIIFTIPTLLKYDVLPYNLIPKGTTIEQASEVPNQGGVPGTAQTVNVNISSAVTDAVSKVSDAVVGVINIQETGFWQDTSEVGTGSGVIYKKENGKAFIVTNHHVIAGASNVEVSLSDGERVPAKVLGSDELMDLAVIQIDAAKVKTVAEIGTSNNLVVGEPVLAIGNPLGLQFSGSVTQGIISGVERTIPQDFNKDGIPDWQSEVLQTDAAINPGNSGGALVNIEGQVIGINSMKIAEQAVEGIGLAIPIDSAIPVIEDLEKFGEVRRPFMGVGLRSLNEIPSYHWQETLKLPKNVEKGVFIVSVMPNSPASVAGLKELDVIVELDGKPIVDVLELRKHLYIDKEIGDSMEVTYYRDGKKFTTTMKLTQEETY